MRHVLSLEYVFPFALISLSFCLSSRPARATCSWDPFLLFLHVIPAVIPALPLFPWLVRGRSFPRQRLPPPFPVSGALLPSPFY